MELSSIDQNICGQWSERDRNAYNRLPFYLMEAQAQNRKRFNTWADLFPKTLNWKANQGDTMRTVIAEPTPIMRQTAFPELLSSLPLTDVITYNERKVDTQLRHHDFVSPAFFFEPQFVDFLRHIDRNVENIDQQITIFEDMFYRLNVFSNAPYIYIAGHGLVTAPTAQMNRTFDAANSKTTAWMQAMATLLMGAQPGYLSFEVLFKALNAFEQQVSATPFSGSGIPAGMSKPLNQKFAAVLSGEAWNNFIDDPWMLGNRPLNMNIVTEGFMGDLWGRLTCKIERFPWRWKLDGDLSPTFPAPENWEVNPDAVNYGQTVPNPDYANTETSQLELAFLVGGPSFDIINIGPPPPEFTRTLSTGDAVKMNWNGKAYLNRQFPTYCKNSDGETVQDINSFGRYIRAQATAVLGIRATTSRNVLPILFKRRVSLSNP